MNWYGKKTERYAMGGREENSGWFDWRDDGERREWWPSGRDSTLDLRYGGILLSGWLESILIQAALL